MAFPILEMLSARIIEQPKTEHSLFPIAFEDFSDKNYHVRAQRTTPFLSYRYSKVEMLLDGKLTQLWISNADLVERFTSRYNEIQRVLSHFPKLMIPLLQYQIHFCTHDTISDSPLLKTIQIAYKHIGDPEFQCTKKRAAERTLFIGRGSAYIGFTRHGTRGDKIIGGGACKQVKTALNLRNGKIHALLVCRKEYLGDDKEWLMTLNELQLYRELQGISGILHLNHAVTTDRKIYMITEYFPQGDLQRAYSSNPIFSFHEKWLIAKQITLGLLNLQLFGIVHRDIKPANILLLRSEGEGGIKAVIADLGSACKLGQKPFIDYTVGSIEYMAPEKMRSLMELLYLNRSAKPSLDFDAEGVEASLSSEEKSRSEAEIELIETSSSCITLIERKESEHEAIHNATPEEIRNPIAEEWSVHCSPEADIWALGLVLYSLFHTETGRCMSFQNSLNSTGDQVVQQLMEKKIQNLTTDEVYEEIDVGITQPEIASLLKTMLQIHPGRRISAREVYQQLVNLPSEARAY